MSKKNKKPRKSVKAEEVDESLAAILQAVKDQRTRYQMLQLASLRRKAEQIDTENKALRNEIRQVDRDRSDVVAFLRRRLGEKCEEVSELTNINSALEQERTSEKEDFLTQMKFLEQQYNEMYDNLITEIRELNGRLSNVESYREQRDFLLDKNNKLESYMTTMEVRAHAIEKEYEKANLIDKDRMRREMEEKLMKFSIDFQKATKARIATATQNVIKENIAINNELSLLIASWQKLYDENESLRSANRCMMNDIETERVIREKLFRKSCAHSDMIDRLAGEHKKIEEFHGETNQLRKIAKNMELKIEKKEAVKAWARIESERIRHENGGLQAQIDVLESQLEDLSSNHDRNIALIRIARAELEECLSFFTGQRSSLARLENLASKLDEIFDRLDELFEVDWLLDVTSEEYKNTSVDTVMFPSTHELAETSLRHEVAEKESVDTTVDKIYDFTDLTSI